MQIRTCHSFSSNASVPSKCQKNNNSNNGRILHQAWSAPDGLSSLSCSLDSFLLISYPFLWMPHPHFIKQTLILIFSSSRKHVITTAPSWISLWESQPNHMQIPQNTYHFFHIFLFYWLVSSLRLETISHLCLYSQHLVQYLTQ